MTKRIISIVMALILLSANFMTIVSSEVYAKGCREESEAENLNSIKKYNKYDYIEKKSKDELENESGIIELDYENHLNELGVLDGEISLLSDEDIKTITSVRPEKIDVQTEIYAVVEKEESGVVDLTNMIKLTEEQVNDLYAQEYYGIETDIDEQISLIAWSNDKAESLNSNDEIALTSSLSTASTSSSTKTTSYFKSLSTTYLKKTIYATSTETSNYVNIIFSTVWITMPNSRMLDCVYLSWKNMKWDETDSNCKISITHKWDEYWKSEKKVYSQNPNKKSVACKYVSGLYEKMKSGIDINVNRNSYAAGEKEIFVWIPLHEDIKDYVELEASEGDGYAVNYTYKNEAVVFNLVLKKESDSSPTVTCIYKHYYTEIKYNYLSFISATITIFSNYKNPLSYLTATIILSGAVNVKIKVEEAGPEFSKTITLNYK